jgi:small subunit ribosomal protein S19
MTRSVWKFSNIDLNIIRRFDEIVAFAFLDFKEHYDLKDVTLDKKFFKQNQMEILDKAKSYSEEEPIEVWSRRSVILPYFLGFTFLVYNGHVFQKILIKSNMLGKKFGEFAATKRIGPNIHSLKKKKKKK